MHETEKGYETAEDVQRFIDSRENPEYWRVQAIETNIKTKHCFDCIHCKMCVVRKMYLTLQDHKYIVGVDAVASFELFLATHCESFEGEE